MGLRALCLVLAPSATSSGKCLRDAVDERCERVGWWICIFGKRRTPDWFFAGVSTKPDTMREMEAEMDGGRIGLTVPDIGGAARPGLCTDCGVSRMGDGRACGRACQFIRPDYPGLEARVHGRAADPEHGEEAFFGVARAMWRARLDPPAEGAQW